MLEYEKYRHELEQQIMEEKDFKKRLETFISDFSQSCIDNIISEFKNTGISAPEAEHYQSGIENPLYRRKITHLSLYYILLDSLNKQGIIEKMVKDGKIPKDSKYLAPNYQDSSYKIIMNNIPDELKQSLQTNIVQMFKIDFWERKSPIINYAIGSEIRELGNNLDFGRANGHINGVTENASNYFNISPHFFTATGELSQLNKTIADTKLYKRFLGLDDVSKKKYLIHLAEKEGHEFSNNFYNCRANCYNSFGYNSPLGRWLSGLPYTININNLNFILEQVENYYNSNSASFNAKQTETLDALRAAIKSEIELQKENQTKFIKSIEAMTSDQLMKQYAEMTNTKYNIYILHSNSRFAEIQQKYGIQGDLRATIQDLERYTEDSLERAKLGLARITEFEAIIRSEKFDEYARAYEQYQAISEKYSGTRDDVKAARKQQDEKSLRFSSSEKFKKVREISVHWNMDIDRVVENGLPKLSFGEYRKKYPSRKLLDYFKYRKDVSQIQEIRNLPDTEDNPNIVRMLQERKESAGKASDLMHTTITLETERTKAEENLRKVMDEIFQGDNYFKLSDCLRKKGIDYSYGEIISLNPEELRKLLLEYLESRRNLFTTEVASIEGVRSIENPEADLEFLKKHMPRDTYESPMMSEMYENMGGRSR